MNGAVKVALGALIYCLATGSGAPALAWDGPPGFRVLCLTNPIECKAGGASSIAATDELNDGLSLFRRRSSKLVAATRTSAMLES